MLATTACTVALIKILIAAKTAQINCNDGRTINQPVVVGNPRAANKLDRTPIGKFTISEVVTGADQAYMQGAAKFSSYHTTPNKHGETEVGYYIHGFLPLSYGQGHAQQQLKGNSIGCVRLNMGGLRFVVGTKVSIN